MSRAYSRVSTLLFGAFLRDGMPVLRQRSMQTNPTNALELPAPIARYFLHETTDPQAVARCFAEDGVVADEAREHHGHAAIAAWNAAAVAKYRMTTEALEATTDGEHTTVRAKVTGSFPGSPIGFGLRFTLDGDRIARLEIAPWASSKP